MINVPITKNKTAMAKFPNSRIQKKISDMKVGEIGFVLVVSLWVSEEKDTFLNGNFPVWAEVNAEAKLKVERVETGFIAYINEIPDIKWMSSEQPSFLTMSAPNLLEVVGFEKLSAVQLYNSCTKEELVDLLEKTIQEEDFEKAASIRNYMEIKFNS